MSSDGSLSNSMDNATKHYSSMFSLPSFRTVLLCVAVLCLVAVNFCIYLLYPSLVTLTVGVCLFAISCLSNIAISKLLLKKDPIFSIRRTFGLSLVCWLIWLVFIAVGAGLSFSFSWVLWAKFSLIGYAAVLTLRFLVFSAISTATQMRQTISILLEPVLSIAVFIVFWANLSGNVVFQLLPSIILSPVIAYLAIFLLLSSIDRLGKRNYSLPALSLFKAFLLNWVDDQNEPLEKHLEAMGEDANIEVNLLKFEASTKLKAAIIVPQVHPGPFKNIGSSLLPSILKREVEKDVGGNVCVPLGILGHELDLASQVQNNKIAAKVITSAKFVSQEALASSLARVKDGVATASCQIFGETAFLSFSLAPETTEDLPQELGRVVTEEAKKQGIPNALMVNCHNSLTDVIDTSEHLDELQRAASASIQKAVALSKNNFRAGSATVYPSEFNIKDGMGPGGITAIVVEVENQKTAYVIIDGNNMVPNLREKIIASLGNLGFSASEIFTTDTHAVTASITGRRGYHPVGEVMDQSLLMRYIDEVVKKADADLDVCKAGYSSFIVSGVRVIGEERLKSITNLVDKAIVRAKQIVGPIFGLEGLILILLLLL
jgi:putative membrane protein